LSLAYFLLGLSCSLASQTSLGDAARLNRERQKFNQHCGYQRQSNGLPSDFVVYWDALRKTVGSSVAVWIRDAESKSNLEASRMKLEFVIRRDGSLGEITVTERAGNAAFQEAAIGAIRDAAPFGPLPDRCGDSLLAQLEMNYDPKSNTHETGEGALPLSPGERARATSPVQGTIASCDGDPFRDSISARELYINNVWYVVLSKWRNSLAAPSGKRIANRGTTWVRIEIWKNGSLKSASVTHSTATKQADDFALQTIHLVPSYFQFPAECADQSWMGWDFGFNYETQELLKPD
jgi:TonB family protein